MTGWDRRALYVALQPFSGFFKTSQRNPIHCRLSSVEEIGLNDSRTIKMPLKVLDKFLLITFRALSQLDLWAIVSILRGKNFIVCKTVPSIPTVFSAALFQLLKLLVFRPKLG